jgi:GntR family transcriptional regulator
MDNTSHMATPLNRQQGDLLHRQLFLALREQIRRGVYPVGSAIPPEDQLGSMFGVSRITVRRAVSELAEAGLVEKRLGRGTFVLANPASPSGRPALTFVESLVQRSRQTKVTLVELTMRVPPPDSAAQLRLPQGKVALHCRRVRSADGVPLIVTDTWVVEQHAKHVTPEKLRRYGLSEILLASGIRFEKVTQTITAVSAEPQIASLLQVEIGSPLLQVVRVVNQKPGAPVMQLTAYLTPERSSIVFDFDASESGMIEQGRLVHNFTK